MLQNNKFINFNKTQKCLRYNKFIDLPHTTRLIPVTEGTKWSILVLECQLSLITYQKQKYNKSFIEQTLYSVFYYIWRTATIDTPLTLSLKRIT